MLTYPLRLRMLAVAVALTSLVVPHRRRYARDLSAAVLLTPIIGYITSMAAWVLSEELMGAGRASGCPGLYLLHDPISPYRQIAGRLLAGWPFWDRRAIL